MEKIYWIILGMVLMINLIGYLSMWSDKRRAIKKRYRIPEKTLFIIAIFGGSLGSILGMKYFHHKTKHWYFKYGMPTILIIQIIVVGSLVYYFSK